MFNVFHVMKYVDNIYCDLCHNPHVIIHNCFIGYTYSVFFMGADLTYCTLLETMKELQGITAQV